MQPLEACVDHLSLIAVRVVQSTRAGGTGAAPYLSRQDVQRFRSQGGARKEGWARQGVSALDSTRGTSRDSTRGTSRDGTRGTSRDNFRACTPRTNPWDASRDSSYACTPRDINSATSCVVGQLGGGRSGRNEGALPLNHSRASTPRAPITGSRHR